MNLDLCFQPILDKCAGIKKRCNREELCMNNGKDFTCLVECPVGYFEGMNQACEGRKHYSRTNISYIAMAS